MIGSKASESVIWSTKHSGAVVHIRLGVVLSIAHHVLVNIITGQANMAELRGSSIGQVIVWWCYLLFVSWEGTGITWDVRPFRAFVFLKFTDFNVDHGWRWLVWVTVGDVEVGDHRVEHAVDRRLVGIRNVRNLLRSEVTLGFCGSLHLARLLGNGVELLG